jgi:hypothetical protein
MGGSNGAEGMGSNRGDNVTKEWLESMMDNKLGDTNKEIGKVIGEGLVEAAKEKLAPMIKTAAEVGAARGAKKVVATALAAQTTSLADLIKDNESKRQEESKAMWNNLQKSHTKDTAKQTQTLADLVAESLDWKSACFNQSKPAENPTFTSQRTNKVRACVLRVDKSELHNEMRWQHRQRGQEKRQVSLKTRTSQRQGMTARLLPLCGAMTTELLQEGTKASTLQKQCSRTNEPTASREALQGCTHTVIECATAVWAVCMCIVTHESMKKSRKGRSEDRLHKFRITHRRRGGNRINKLVNNRSNQRFHIMTPLSTLAMILIVITIG